MIKTRIVKIGNSQGVRIPKRFLAHVDLGLVQSFEIEPILSV